MAATANQYRSREMFTGIRIYLTRVDVRQQRIAPDANHSSMELAHAAPSIELGTYFFTTSVPASMSCSPCLRSVKPTMM